MEFPGGCGRPLPLARQGSVYSLTFDELQSALGGVGRDFGSMNMDELLRNIWTAEESHAIAAAAATTVTSSAIDPAASIQRQGSLTLPRTLSQKTVDEVWRDIMGFGAPSAVPAEPAPPPARPAPRQPTLGEMTLEEFLVRAGVGREDMAQPAPPAPPQPQALFPQGNVFASMVPPLSLGNGLITGVAGQGGGGAPTVASPARPVVSNGLGNIEGGDLSSISPPVPYLFNGGLRGRKASAVERVAERRQRRMIKNRESAARSRARKQAYMMELEAEVATLKEQNEKLHKKQVEMLEKQKNEVLERVSQQLGPKAKRFCLRRTLTGPW